MIFEPFTSKKAQKSMKYLFVTIKNAIFASSKHKLYAYSYKEYPERNT